MNSFTMQKNTEKENDIQIVNREENGIQIVNKEENGIQIVNREENVIQTVNKEENVIQTVNKKEDVIQTVNKEENDTQTVNKKEDVIQTVNKEENDTQTVNEEGRETKIYKVTFNGRTYRYCHYKKLPILKEKIEVKQFLLIHRILCELFKNQIEKEFNIIFTWGIQFENFFQDKEKQSKNYNITRKEIRKKIKSLEKEINELDSKNENFNKKGIGGDLVVYNSILDKIDANEKKTNEKKTKFDVFLKALKEDNTKYDYNEILNNENFKTFEQLKKYIKKKVDEIKTLKNNKKKVLVSKKDELKKLSKELKTLTEEINNIKKKLYIEYLGKNVLHTKDHLFNIFDNIFLLKRSNMEKSLNFLFNSLEFLVIKGFSRGFFKYSFVNQHPLILKYCEKYDCTNLSLLFYNLINSFCFFKNKNFRGISNLSGDFNMCQFTKDKVNKFFFSYKYLENSHFYIKYNMNKNLAKFLFTPYCNKKRQSLCSIQEYGLRFYRDGGKVYEFYIKDGIFTYYVDINELKNKDYFNYIKLKYIKNSDNKECNSIHSISDILKSIGIKNPQVIFLSNDIGFDMMKETINKNENSENILNNIKNLIQNDLFKKYFSIDEKYIFIKDIKNNSVLNIYLDRENVDNFKFTVGIKDIIEYITNDKNYSECNLFDKKIKEKSLIINTYGYIWEFFQNTFLSHNSIFLNIYFDNRYLPLLNKKDDEYNEYLNDLLEDENIKISSYRDFFKQKDKTLITIYDIGAPKYLFGKNSKFFTFFICFNYNIADYNQYLNFKFCDQTEHKFYVYLCDLQKIFCKDIKNPFVTYLELTSKDFENYKENQHQKGVDNIFFHGNNTYRQLIARIKEYTEEEMKNLEKSILENLKEYLYLIYLNNTKEIKEEYDYILNDNEQKNNNISNDTEQKGINITNSSTNNTLDSINTSDTETNIYNNNKNHLENLKKIERIRSWFKDNAKIEIDTDNLNLTNNDSKEPEYKYFDIEIHNKPIFKIGYNLQIVENECYGHPLDVGFIFKDYFLKEKRTINFINSIPNLNINGKDIITTYDKADNDFKKHIEKFFFDLIYLNDLTKSEYRIKKMNGNDGLLHAYFSHGSKSNRMYFYLKGKNINLLNIIGHNIEKK